MARPDRLVIFDIDGTLCDTFDADGECFWSAAASLLGSSIDPTGWEHAPHMTDWGLAEWLWQRQLGRSPTTEELGTYAALYEAHLRLEIERAPERFASIAGARVVVEKLPAFGWNVAIATGGWSGPSRAKLVAAGLPADLLTACSDDSHDRRIVFQLAASRSDKRCKNADTVLVGDGVWDVHVATHHAWRFLGVGRGQRAEDLRRAGATAVIGDFSDLDGVLKVLNDCGVPRIVSREL